MKMLGILLVLIVLSFQCLAAQPFEYQNKPSFCDRVFHYIKQRPVYETSRPKRHFIPTANAPVVSNEPRIKLTRNLPPIDSIFVRGGVNLQIIGGQPKNKISVKTVYPELAVKVCDGAIYISNSKPVDCNQNPRPCIKLYINQLKQLVVAGNSCITGTHLNTYCGLTINHCGSGSVCLNGPVHLVRIVNSGTATICVPCVTTDHVHILATRSGVVKVRGTTSLLLVRAFQCATVDARFMCANTAMIQAADQSLVTVRAKNSLQAFASGMSNIYYYTSPYELVQHNTLSGNVFQMGCW